MADTSAPQTEIERVFSELLEKSRKEAYAEGWKDAIAAVHVGVNLIPFPEGSGGEIGEPIRKLDGKKQPALLPGTTPHFVFNAIKKTPGMTGAQIVIAVTEGGHRVPEPNIRTAIFRLANRRKAIVNRHGKWFPA